MKNWLFLEEEGQGMVEFALILALVALVAVSAAGQLGQRVTAFFGEFNEAIESAT